MNVPNLHSRYNPQAEAERYINSLELKEDIECFVLIEPGEGYMIPVLQKKNPNAKILALHAVDPENEKILEKHLSDIQNPSKIKIIEWRPAMNYYREAYVKLLSIAVNYIKRLNAEKRTVSAFGTRWVRNFFKNLGNIRSALIFKETDIPVIITGSGPSLEQAIPIIKEAQDKSLIIAASSSLTALNHYGIKPDLAITTDGGAWALKHLYNLFREDTQKNNNLLPVLAVNLCAALPSQCYAAPQLILNDGSLWQSVVLHELQLPSVLIGQRGTVTASAVELALQLTSGNIYLAGTDLAVNDMRTHVKPYAFDILFLEKSNRFNPFYSQSFIRSRQMKEGGSLDIYADWFKSQYDKWPKRIYNIKEKPSRKGAKTQSYAKKEECFKIVKQKDIYSFCEIGINIIINSLNDNNYSDKLRAELIPLIGEDIEKFISSLRRTEGTPSRLRGSARGNFK